MEYVVICYHDANANMIPGWPDVAEWSRDTMKIRYSLVPYMYTLFYQASTTGSTVMRALQWQFPNDPSLVGADRQFMLGPAIMVIPVLNPGVSTVDGVFPGDQPWYDWYNQTAVPESSHQANTTIDAPQGHIPVYVNGGNVLPLQDPAYTLRDARRNPWNVLVALDNSGAAEGSLYLDDGESQDPTTTTHVELSVRNSRLTVRTTGDYHGETVTPLSGVIVMGVSKFDGRVEFNGRRLDSKQVHYNRAHKLLQVSGLQDKTSRGAWTADWELSWY